MSDKCYLEVYTNYKNLNEKRKNYWEQYKELKKSNLNMDDDDIANMLQKNNNLKQVEPISPYKFNLDEDYIYVFDEELIYKYIVPDTFLLPFSDDNLIKYNSEYDEESFKKNEDFEEFVMKGYSCKTTVEDAIKRMENRIDKISKIKENEDFIKSSMNILHFLKNKPSDSIIVLNSGETEFNTSLKDFFELDPFEGIRSIM